MAKILEGKSKASPKKFSKMAYYSPFIRVSQDDERIVEGIASSEAIDSYGDIVRITAIKDALPDYMKYANLRSMHSNIAAGVVKGTKVDEENKVFYITAKVVDDQEWKKVKEEVYKGFSIGGLIENMEPIMVEVADGDGNMHEVFTGGYEITEIKLIEISLVDRPANPDSLIQSYKSAKLKRFDTKDGGADVEEAFVPDTVLQPNLTSLGKLLNSNKSPSSIKTLKKRNPLSILAPRNMSKVTKAQMQKVAGDTINAMMKDAGITDDNLDELRSLSRGEIIEAAKEMVEEVVDSLATFVKAEGAEKPSEEEQEESNDETAENSEEESVETDGESEDVEDNTGEEEVPANEDEEDSEEDGEEEENNDGENEEKTPAEKSVDVSPIVEAIKDLGETLVKTIKKSNEETVAEIQKSNKQIFSTVKSVAKQAGVSSQIDGDSQDEQEDEDLETPKKAFAKGDPWGKKIA